MARVTATNWVIDRKMDGDCDSDGRGYRSQLILTKQLKREPWRHEEWESEWH